MNKIISKRSLETPASGIRKIFNKAVGLEGVIHLEIGEPDFDTPALIKKEVCKALEMGYTHYTHNAGLIELRRSIASYYERQRNIALLPEENVIVTVGGTGALFLSLLAVMDPGDEVLIPDPGYPPYVSMIKMLGGVPRFYTLKESERFIPNLEEIESKINDRTKVLIINNPHNPTGVVYSGKIIGRIVDLCREKKIVLISDEVYERMVYDNLRHYSALEFEDGTGNVVVINSFSKTYAMTGWRIGFAVAMNKELIETMTKLQESVVACAPSMLQMAAITALENCESCMEEMRRKCEERRNVMVREVSKIKNTSFVKPQGALYLLLNVSEYTKDSYEFAEKLLLERKVGVAPGRAFGVNGEGYIRLSFANSVENIIKGVRILKEYLESYFS